MMRDETEYRYAELDASGDGMAGIVIRYGDVARFGEFSERFEPRSIRYSDVIVNLQHRRETPVARSGAGLELMDSDTELRAEIRPPDTIHGQTAISLVKAGILRGLSMEFRMLQERWDGKQRIIQRAELKGIGIVDRPAYSDSDIALRFAGMNAQSLPRNWRISGYPYF